MMEETRVHPLQVFLMRSCRSGVDVAAPQSRFFAVLV